MRVALKGIGRGKVNEDMEKRYFEDYKVEDLINYKLKIKKDQINKFLNAIGKNYQKHITELTKKYGLIVPPHIMPAILAEESMKLKHYPDFAIHKIDYKFLKPIKADEELQVIERVIEKNDRVAKDYGQIILEREIKNRAGETVIQAIIDHRVLKFSAVREK